MKTLASWPAPEDMLSRPFLVQVTSFSNSEEMMVDVAKVRYSPAAICLHAYKSAISIYMDCSRPMPQQVPGVQHMLCHLSLNSCRVINRMSRSRWRTA